MQVHIADTSGTRTATIEYGPKRDLCSLKLSLDDGRAFTAESSDYFECLILVRRDLEAEGIVVCCQGARRDVWPSGMARDMGAGLKAYVLTIGRAPERGDLISIFGPADRELIGTVEEQRRHFREWWESLRTPGG
ncbi:MAG: hypothetical protein M3O91_06745 [Chloroflexota bacterium]|nr:hypothetical protein [Chloroflexota bacterium]